jgi:hypothetical protein
VIGTVALKQQPRTFETANTAPSIPFHSQSHLASEIEDRRRHAPRSLRDDDALFQEEIAPKAAKERQYLTHPFLIHA